MYDVSVALRSLPDPFTTAQAVDIGVSEHVLARLVRRGDAQRLSRGVYRQPQGADSGAGVHALRRWQVLHRDFLTRARAALASYPHHALSHATAALVCGWPVVLHPQMPVHLTAVRVEPRSRRVDDRVLHHSDSIINDVVVVEGLRVLTADRTVADCLRTMSRPAGVAVADAALRAGEVTVAGLQTMVASQRGWVGCPKARGLLPLVDLRRESWLESYSFVRLRERGVDLPTPQVEVFDERGCFVARVDGMWVSDATVAEADGHGKYLPGGYDEIPTTAATADTVQRVVDEKVREDALRALGLEVVRWDTQQIRHHTDGVVAAVRAARRRGDLQRFRGRLKAAGRWLGPPR